MLLPILAYFGGILTILSPCILPVLPFVFARADRPFRRSGLPLLIGMALTFALVATLAAVGGEWVARANHFGRMLALVVLAILGLSLLWPRFSQWLARPAVALGNRLSKQVGTGDESVAAGLGLGVATGLLWAPCAGPVLGLILATAAIQGASAQTSLLLLAYALGAMTSLAAALFLGGRVFGWMKRSLGAGEWLRRGLGVLVLAGVVTIALGLDTGVLARVSLASTAGIEEKLVAAIMPDKARAAEPAPASAMADAAMDTLPVLGQMPSLAGATGWLNSPPLGPAELRGKVVLVDIWTYSCINCIRTLPWVTAWNAKYKDHGLVILGVHSPEFAFERDRDNVAKAIARYGIAYPVVMDNKFAIWRGFHNRYWPAHYFIDAKGRIRAQHFGEGGYRHAEDVIRALLREAGYDNLPGGYVDPNGQGDQAPAAARQRSPETYVGYGRASGFAGGRLVQDQAQAYHGAGELAVNQWTLDGRWRVGKQQATLVSAQGSIRYRFRGRDLHLVLAPASGGKPVRFRVAIDGAAPGADHGADIDADGLGTVTGQRLYQLVRQADGMGEREVTITFLDPGVRVFAFTFG